MIDFNEPTQPDLPDSLPLLAVFKFVLKNLDILALWICGACILEVDVLSWRFVTTAFIVAICSGVSINAWRKIK